MGIVEKGGETPPLQMHLSDLFLCVLCVLCGSLSKISEIILHVDCRKGWGDPTPTNAFL
jgi:hypothetical protein